MREAHPLSQIYFRLTHGSSVSALRGARAGIFDAVEALTDLLLVAGAEAKHSASAVKLAADVLVHLAEFVELSGNVIVLELDNLSMLLKGILLSKVVNVLATKGTVSYL